MPNLKQSLTYREIETTGVPVSLCPVNDCPSPRVLVLGFDPKLEGIVFVVV